MEFLKQEGYLIFELTNILVPIFNEDTNITEIKSFANNPVKNYAETSANLHAYFEE